MTKEELIDLMSFNKKTIQPVEVFQVNGSFILGVYNGSLSKYDILIKYRQKNGRNWSRIRTPKHIHWAVDILIKMNIEKKKTEEFLDFLINIWKNIKPIKNTKEQNKCLKIENLLKEGKGEINKYKEISKHGEYSINFLMLLAKLLMIQEKTNLETAYMFKNLLEALKSGKDIFKIVSTATHNRR
jgi:hypothetical protein